MGSAVSLARTVMGMQMAADVVQWLSQAQEVDLTDAASQRLFRKRGTPAELPKSVQSGDVDTV